MQIRFLCIFWLASPSLYIAMGLTKILVQVKLPREQEASKEKKEERSGEKKERKERKGKREKSKDNHKSSKHRQHGHKKRKREEKNEPSRKDGLWKEAASKDVAELLEKSGLTEEHGPTCATQEHCESSESTQNSSKSRKLEVPNSSSGSHGNTIIRLRLPLQKHRDPKPTPTYVKDEPCFAGRVTSKDPKATPADEGNCFSGRSRTALKDLRATPASEGPCFSGRTASESPTATPSSEVPCSSARAPSKDPKVIAAIKGPGFSALATLESGGPCFSGRAISKDHGAVQASEATSCFSGRAVEVPSLHKLSDDAHIQSVERGNRQLSNENIKSTEAPQEQKLDENAHAHPSSSSKGSKRARKLEKHFRDLIESWKPAPLFLDAEPGTNDLGWLFGNSSVKPDAPSCGVSSNAADLGPGSSAFPFQPRALYLPELEMYQLPYVVPL